jgi:hypothetical protein
MKALRPICLLLAGLSLLFVVACGMTLYAMSIGESSVQFRQSSPQDVMTRVSEARDVATVRNLCLPLAQIYNSQSNLVRELSNLWRSGLMTVLCWAVLSAFMFAWVFAVLRNSEQPAPAPA